MRGYAAAEPEGRDCDLPECDRNAPLGGGRIATIQYYIDVRHLNIIISNKK